MILLSQAVQVAMVAAVPSGLLGLATLLATFRNHSVSNEIKLSINGRLSELLEQSKKASYNEGMVASQARSGLPESEAVAKVRTDLVLQHEQDSMIQASILEGIKNKK